MLKIPRNKKFLDSYLTLLGSELTITYYLKLKLFSTFLLNVRENKLKCTPIKFLQTSNKLFLPQSDFFPTPDLNFVFIVKDEYIAYKDIIYTRLAISSRETRGTITTI